MKRGDEACWIAVTDMEHSLSHSFENLHLQNEYQSQVKTENSIEFNEGSLMESGAVTISKDNDDDDNLEFSEIEENNVQEDNSGEIIEHKVIEPEPKCFFEERYDVFEELGKGRYGVVRKVIDKLKGIVLAAKFVRTIKAKDRQLVLEEINVMNKLKHPKLLRLLAAFESPKETIMVTEYISGGELFERVVADDFTLTEKDSILFVRQICEGVAYMHEEKVVHMDLKPENIMCQTHTSHRIKLIDFGLAQTLKPNTPVRVLFGTPEFISPEIIGFEPIGTESDMWSIGVICYVLLSGLSPFMGDSDAETFTNITRADYDFDDKAFDAISQEAMDFISSLLIKRKELRMSARDCLDHPWLAQCAENMSRVVLSTDKLKKFIVRRKWQKTGNAIRALGRMATLSANSRKNISSTSPLNSDILFEESIPEEMKNIYLLSEQSSALVAASLNSPESDDDNSELNIQSELEEILKTTMSPLAVNSLECTADALEDINYEKSMTDAMKFTDDINEASSVIETKFQDATTFDFSTQLTIPVDTAYEHMFETPERQKNPDESTIEQKQDTVEIEQPLTPLHLSTRDIHSGIDSFQDNTDSQFASDPSNIDEKDEARESMRPTTRKVSLGRIVNTGSVTRTAKMFEQENLASQSRTPINRIVLPTADARPQNERIRKAFAFWQN